MRTYGELLVCIGLCLMMANIEFFQCRGFWVYITIDPFETSPYHFSDIFPCTLFKDILKKITITDEPPPEYKDPFLEVRKLIDVWNKT